jgi:hypothetical protein
VRVCDYTHRGGGRATDRNAPDVRLATRPVELLRLRGRRSFFATTDTEARTVCATTKSILRRAVDARTDGRRILSRPRAVIGQRDAAAVCRCTRSKLKSSLPVQAYRPFWCHTVSTTSLQVPDYYTRLGPSSDIAFWIDWVG